MTPLEQAEALLKAAEEATRAPWIPSRDFERTWWVHAPEGEDKCPLHNGGRGIVESNTPTDNEENDIKFVALARNTAPAIALALIEKHRALEAALAETGPAANERPNDIDAIKSIIADQWSKNRVMVKVADLGQIFAEAIVAAGFARAAPTTKLGFVKALQIATDRFRQNPNWKRLDGTPWANDAPVIAAELMCKHTPPALAETEEVKVERVARAIIMQTQPEYEDDEIWAEDLDILKRQATRNQRGSCFLLARAAIAAMGE